MTLEYLKNKYTLDLSQPVIEIPGVSRLDLIRWIRELDFTAGAEIGVYRGEYSRLICRLNPQLKLYLIDSWVKSPEYKELGEQNFDQMYQDTLDKMIPSIRKGKCVMIRKTSMEALNDFADESLDFVYIDANHEDPFVTQDVYGWAKKVRKGGIVSGHDYIRVKQFNYTIIDAVNKYTQEHRIPLFILGSHAKEPKVVRENIRSWCFVK